MLLSVQVAAVTYSSQGLTEAAAVVLAQLSAIELNGAEIQAGMLQSPHLLGEHLKVTTSPQPCHSQPHTCIPIHSCSGHGGILWHFL